MIGCYERVSTDIQAEQGHSIPEQKDRLEKYCSAMGWNEYKHYTDGGFTGANIDRPALQELIKDVRAGKIKKVIVYKLDRLSRSQKDTLYLIEDVFLGNNADFISLSENFDTSSPFGKAMIGILAVFAQLEREQIKERMKMGKTARAKQGLFHGGANAPVGYDYINGQLVTNEYEKEQILIVYEKYSQGINPADIIKYLNDRGYTTKYGQWNKTLVYKITSIKTYCGYITYKGETYRGNHEAFISEELYDSVQRVKEKRQHDKRLYERRDGVATSYLGGLLYCGICGAKMHRKSRTYDGKKGHTQHNQYVCDNRLYAYRQGKKCYAPKWDMETLDNIVFDEIRGLKLEHIDLPHEEIKKPNIGQIERLQGQIDKLLDLYSVGGIPLDSLQGKIQSINDKILTLQQEQERYEAEKRKEHSLEDVKKAIGDFDDILDSGDFSRIRATINALIEKIVVDDDITIYWMFD